MTFWIRTLPLSAKEEEVLTQSKELSLPLDDLPDLSMVNNPSQLRHLLAALYPDSPPETLDRMRERYWSLGKTIDIDDVIAVPLKHKKVVVLGEVTEAYHYDVERDEEHAHCISVKWQDKTIPFRKFGKNISRLENAGALEEVKDDKIRGTLRTAMPYSYNRFAALKWLIGVFIVWRLFMFMHNRMGF